MNVMPTIEFSIAFVLAISLIPLATGYKGRKYDKWPAICLFLSVIWLVIDGFSYSFISDIKAPFLLVYITNLLAYAWGNFIFIFFIKYWGIHICENTKMSRLIYQIPIAMLAINMLIIVIEYARGSIVVFEDGVEVADNGLPVIVSVIWIIVLIYLPVFIIIARKRIDAKLSIILIVFDILQLFATVASSFVDNDHTVIIGSIEIFLAASFLQKNRAESIMIANVENEKKKEVNSLKRLMNMIFALSDEYDPIIVFDPESGEYDWFMSMTEDVIENTSMSRHGDDLYKNIEIDAETILHPDDKESYKEFYSRENMLAIAKTGESRETENRWFIQTDNMFRWKYNKAVRMTDDIGHVYIVIGVIDTTVKKMKEEEYMKQQEYIQEQQALSNGLAREYHTVWLVEGAGEHKLHLYRSTGKKTIQKAVQLGLDEPFYDESMEKYVMDCVHEDDRERVMEAVRFETIERETPDIGLYVVSYKRYYDEEGNVDYHQMCFAKAVADNGVINYILAFRDADKMLREQLEQQRQLQEARVQAEASNEAKTNFLFNMSHDIRTPMNAITGFTNMAIKHVDDKEKVLDYLSKVQESENMLLSLINSILEVSRIESGKATLDEEPGDVYNSFATIENTMREMAETKDIDLSFGFNDIIDRYVYADFNRCMRVFVNIISNSIKYTKEGGFVMVKCKQLGKAKGGIGRYQYTVTDNGIGMSKEFQKHVFEQFSRENSATVSGIQGTGLGMAVCKSFVDLMGGTITVKSTQGKGSEFKVVLPFRIQKENKNSDAISENGKAESDEIMTPLELKGKKVLLVEDNELNREIAVDILEEVGMNVEEADDGTTAVKIMKEKGADYFDFILMDIQMPLMDGYEATRQIRKMFPEKIIPIIALSANAFVEDKEKSIEAGMNDHIAKPIKIGELIQALEKFCS